MLLPTDALLSANPALARIHGFPSPEALLRRLKGGGPHASPGRLQEILARAEADGRVLDLESEVRRADGGTFWISA